jgi:hypothetical protein
MQWERRQLPPSPTAIGRRRHRRTTVAPTAFPIPLLATNNTFACQEQPAASAPSTPWSAIKAVVLSLSVLVLTQNRSEYNSSTNNKPPIRPQVLLVTLRSAPPQRATARFRARLESQPTTRQPSQQQLVPVASRAWGRSPGAEPRGTQVAVGPSAQLHSAQLPQLGMVPGCLDPRPGLGRRARQTRPRRHRLDSQDWPRNSERAQPTTHSLMTHGRAPRPAQVPCRQYR